MFVNVSAGAVPLANAVVEACAASRAAPAFKFLYPSEASLKEKIETIAREIYRADGVKYSEKANGTFLFLFLLFLL